MVRTAVPHSQAYLFLYYLHLLHCGSCAGCRRCIFMLQERAMTQSSAFSRATEYSASVIYSFASNPVSQSPISRGHSALPANHIAASSASALVSFWDRLLLRFLLVQHCWCGVCAWPMPLCYHYPFKGANNLFLCLAAVLDSHGIRWLSHTLMSDRVCLTL